MEVSGQLLSLTGILEQVWSSQTREGQIAPTGNVTVDGPTHRLPATASEL